MVSIPGVPSRFEDVDIAGKRLANPCALTLSATHMLRHLGGNAAASHIESAVRETLADPSHQTRDLGGTATLDEITASISEKLGVIPAALIPRGERPRRDRR